MKKKKRKYLAYYMWIFPWIMTRKSSFLFQQFHIFHIQVNVLPLHWKILRLPIFRETLYKDFYNKNAQRQPPRKTSHQSLYPDQFYVLPRFRVVFLCLFTTSCFAEGGKQLQFDASSWTKRNKSYSQWLSQPHVISSTTEQLISFEY